jgi:hypothetical protein
VPESPLRGRPLVGRRSVLRLLGVATLGLVAGCHSGKQRAAPASVPASTTPGSRSPQPAATSAPPATTSATTPTSPKPTVSALSPDQLVAQRVAAAEQALLAAYDAVAVAHPELVGRLAPFRADHAAHLHGLVPGALPSTTASSSTAPVASLAPSNTTAPSTIASSTTAPVSSPPTSAQIFQQLAEVERNAAAARVSDVASTSGSLARLIASIGGCEAAHAALLAVAT